MGYSSASLRYSNIYDLLSDPHLCTLCYKDKNKCVPFNVSLISAYVGVCPDGGDGKVCAHNTGHRLEQYSFPAPYITLNDTLCRDGFCNDDVKFYNI